MRLYTLVLLLLLTTLSLYAAPNDEEKVHILTDYLLKQKMIHRDPSKSVADLTVEARGEAIATVYGKPEFQELTYDDSSEMFFGRIISTHGNFTRDVNFYMPRKRAREFKKHLDAGEIRIKHAFEDNTLVFEEISVDYKNVDYPLHVNLPNTFTLKLGGYFTGSQNTEILLRKKGIGATLNLQDLFDMQERTQAFRVEGTYKFNPKHRLEFSWYNIKNSSHQEVKKSFDIAGKTVNTGASLDIYFDTQITKLMYAYSAYHTNKLALDFRVGFHATGISTGYTAKFNIFDINKSNSSDSVSVTAPLPVIGVGMNYEIIPNLNLLYHVDYFFISYDSSVTGSLTDSTLALDYKFNRYFGIGGGLNSTSMRFKAQQDETKIEVRHEVIGGIVYGILSY